MPELKRMLLVEDDPAGVELTLAALRELNLANDVEVVHDGEEAMDYLYGRGPWQDRPPGNPAVVLLDLKMPKVGGLEVLRQIRSEKNLCMVPVVIMTSSNQDKDLIESYRLGTNSYVVKPVVMEDFVHAVKEVGVFWAMVNEPPPGSTPRLVRPAGTRLA